VKGGISLKNYFGEKSLAIFVKVPSLEVLEQRLNNRSTESADIISQRLFKAKFEMTFQDEFDVVLVNENLENSLEEAQRLYDEFKKK
jgi:guanylate kinase